MAFPVRKVIEVQSKARIWFMNEGMLWGESKPCDGGIIDGEETEFAMVDGKEQEGIGKWVRERRHLFGAGSGNPSATPSTMTTQQQQQQHISTAAAGSTTIASMNLASDDEDEDFAASSSDSDSGSDSDSSSDEDAEGEDEAEDTDASGEEDEQEAELDPSKHPLLRPGAMPKNISRAAVDMAVGLVEEDVVMGGPNEDGGEDEVDELED
ncbi:hypothetical protein DL96DRAFT_1678719 [Flagelloscypha sp. PMI_526]|nr:hypothetical protein DL96DRAFT_1678719 [Flagelloscypha sp. PMI_526]